MSSDNIKKLKIKGGTIKFIVMVVLLVVSGIFIVVYGVYTEKQYAEVAGSILYDNQDSITSVSTAEQEQAYRRVYNNQISSDRESCELQAKVYKEKDYSFYKANEAPTELLTADEEYWYFDDPTTWYYNQATVGIAPNKTEVRGNYGKEVQQRAESEEIQDVATLTLEDMLEQNRTNMSTGFCLSQTEIDDFNKKYTPDKENKVEGDEDAITEYNMEVESGVVV